MKRILILWFAVMCAGVVFGQTSSISSAKKKIAVYVTGGNDEGIKKVLGAKLVQAIVNNGQYSAVERTADIIAKLRQEQNYQRSGNVDDSQIGRLGKELGADFVCIAEIVEAFGEKYISARLVDANVFEAVKFADVDGNMNNMNSLVSMSESVASKLLGGNSNNRGNSYGNSDRNTQTHPAEPEMVFVQGGTFWMGCSSEQQGSCENDESPLHQVTVSDFYIGKYEVTQKQWQLLMGTSIYQQQNKAGGSSNYGTGDNYPMYYVSWEEAQMFIERLNAATGKNYRLPTEAEWEYAARGGNKSKQNKYAGSNFVENVAWMTTNSNSSTHPVGTKMANELGIYDMSGNVWEWCYDWYGSYSSGSQNNPIGASSGSSRVGRGGSWNDGASYCRVAYRYNISPGNRGNLLGFRVACSSN